MLGAVGTLVVRLDADGLVTVVARTRVLDTSRLAPGTRGKLEPRIPLATALATGDSASLDDLSQAEGAFAEEIRALGSGRCSPSRSSSAGGTGLLGIRDRVEALGGSFQVSSSPKTGTLVQVAFPLLVPADAAAADAGGHTSR
ncbi:hypothetical protein GCM10009609_53920 [Pseudonocardia aurantiaca]|uniref:Histidine kinase/HSP90-like ATPase domain-containing protein n=1 Tax=Pseudonocardia aurantiaca TaxID=75290 RepID=A0ABW4FWC6_9PSEU